LHAAAFWQPRAFRIILQSAADRKAVAQQREQPRKRPQSSARVRIVAHGSSLPIVCASGASAVAASASRKGCTAKLLSAPAGNGAGFDLDRVGHWLVMQCAVKQLSKL
jgi:hypothetical protein